MPFNRRFSDRAFRYIWSYFPLIGFLIGTVTAMVYVMASYYLEPFQALFISLFASILITGAMHEDGLADTIDGLWGGQTIPQRLEIMQDSRIGTFGVIGLIFAIGVRFFIWHNLSLREPQLFITSLVAVPIVARGLVMLIVLILPYARKENSKTVAFFSNPSYPSLLLGMVASIVLSWHILEQAFWPSVSMGLITAMVCGLIFRSKLKGFTGDCLGAVIILTEIGMYFGLQFCPTFR
jgi:adenosylcobinamide-GDP ribazoletransferase